MSQLAIRSDARMFICLSDGPKELRVTPGDDDYRRGEIVTLIANANPPAEYKWVDSVTTKVYTLTAEVVITNEMSETIVGTAYNTVGGKLMQSHLTINIVGGIRVARAASISPNRTLFIICSVTSILCTLLYICTF